MPMSRRIIIRSTIKSKDNTYCSVPNCKSSGKENPGISFHKFPPEGDIRRKIWILKFRIGKKVSKRMRCCSKHFRNEDYNYSELPTRRPRLKKTDVPSLNLPKSPVPFENQNTMMKVSMQVLSQNSSNKSQRTDNNSDCFSPPDSVPQISEIMNNDATSVSQGIIIDEQS